jgi:hypothetical protein
MTEIKMICSVCKTTYLFDSNDQVYDEFNRSVCCKCRRAGNIVVLQNKEMLEALEQEAKDNELERKITQAHWEFIYEKYKQSKEEKVCRKK